MWKEYIFWYLFKIKLIFFLRASTSEPAGMTSKSEYIVNIRNISPNLYYFKDSTAKKNPCIVYRTSPI